MPFPHIFRVLCFSAIVWGTCAGMIILVSSLLFVTVHSMLDFERLLVRVKPCSYSNGYSLKISVIEVSVVEAS